MTTVVAQTQARRVLPDLSVEAKATVASLEQQIAEMRAENAKLKAKAGQAVVQGLTLRVSAKGAVSVYGMGKWPVTLYRGQWEKLLGEAKAILEFIEANKDSLSVKDQD